MKEKIVRLLNRYGAQLCALAVVSATLSSQACRFIYYQPEEPAGLADFAKKMNND